MKYQITIETERKKELITSQLKALDLKVIEIKNLDEARSGKQNRSLHKWFQLLADELNSKHFDMRAIILDYIEMPWSGYAVKEYLFKPLLRQEFGKKSTTQLFKSKEIDLLYDVINRTIIERTKGQVEVPPWPCKQSLEEQAINKLNNTSL